MSVHKPRLDDADFAAVQKYKEMKLPIPMPEDLATPRNLIDRDRRIVKLESDVKTWREKFVELEKELFTTAQRDTLLEGSLRFVRPMHIKPRNSSRDESAVCVIGSDWHLEEKVDPLTIAGVFNEYNPKIAEQRATKFFQNSLKLSDMAAKDTDIKEIVFFLLGDIITGYIHAEYVESNYMAPVDAILFARKVLSGGLDFWLENSNYNIRVVCCQGNHDRTTEKRRVSTYAENSFAWLLYNVLANQYEKNPRVQFKLTKAYLNYVDVYSMKIRAHHGDNVQYSGGIGGLTIPLNKAIAGWNKATRADLDVLGHYHQLMDGGNFIVNGSMIGYNAFAESIKASPEPPQQAFFLLNKSRNRKTVHAPIFVD